MNVLHVTPALAAAVMAGESTLLPLDGKRCARCGGEGIVEFRDEDNHVYADESCHICNGWGVVPPDVSGRCGVAVDGLLVGTVDVVEVLPVHGFPIIGWRGPCVELFRRPSGDLLVHFTAPAEFTDLSHLLPLLGPPEELVGRWVALVADPVPTSERCPMKGCAQFEGRVPGWVYGSNWDFVPCQTCNGDGSCPPVPVPAAPVGTITEEALRG